MGDIHREHIIASVHIGEIAAYSGFTSDILCSTGTDHEVRQAGEFILLDEVFDEKAGTVSAVGVLTVDPPVRVGYNGLHDFGI